MVAFRGRIPLVTAILVCALCATAKASPSLTFGVKATPIPGFPDTGAIAGGGTTLRLSLHMSGSEYEGAPPPLERLLLSLPQGMDESPADFPTCPGSTLGPSGSGAASCPAGSKAGGAGVATVLTPQVSSLSPECQAGEACPDSSGLSATGDYEILHVSAWQPEQLATQAYNAGEGAFTLLFSGLQQTLLAGAGIAGKPESHSLELQLPALHQLGFQLPYTEVELRLGSAVKQKGKTRYALRMPSLCPLHELPFTVKATFGAFGSASPQTIERTTSTPCPRVRIPASTQPSETGTAQPPAPCLSKRRFTIHIARRKGVAYRRVSAFLNGHPLAVHQGRRITASIDLAGLPMGTYVLRIVIETTRGHRIVQTHTYHTCTPRG